MSDKTVKIFSTPTCPYCKMAKEWMKENNIEYTDVDVSTDEKAAQEMTEKSGQMGVPVILVGDEVLVGFDKPKLEALLLK
ncbi:MAG: NrdH-redoxin [Parcubacteria group bacterium]|nr:NrdH-redoxin [Parcubacteria group bacterium]|tara:strand:+ start:248 stop:487 length:240 start_codon:yes stop_codon:yes gene_type:complete